MNSPQQNQKIELTKNQQNPYLARPEEFDIAEPNEITSRAQPFHGQCGDSTREYNKLLAIRVSKQGKSKVIDKGLKLPTATDDADRPRRY